MKKIFEKLLSTLLATVLLFGLVPVAELNLTASAEEASGVCGDNLTWMFKQSTGVLNIDGFGDMWSYGFDVYEGMKETPWKPFEDLITSVSIGDEVTSIGDDAFNGFGEITEINIPAAISYIGDNALLNCLKLEGIVVDKKNAYYSSDEYGVLYTKNKDILIQYPTGNTRKEYYVPDGVKTIGGDLGGAFFFCDYLEKVVISDTVLEISGGSFHFCGGLKEVVFGNGVEIIGCEAFASTGDKLKVISLPNSVKVLCSGAFWGNDYVDVYIGSGIELIEEDVFGWGKIDNVYYSGTEKEWNNINIDEGNDALLNATIHFLGEEVHEHSYSSSITKEATCKETGVMTFTCSCNDSYTQVIPVTAHSLSHDTIPSTCKVPGIEYDYCIHCGETFNSASLPIKSHSWGTWQIRVDPTGHSDGEEYRVCSACGTEETKSIPKLNIIKDDKTGIEIEYDNQYDSGVSVQVTEVFDGTSFRLIESLYGNSNAAIFDITTVKDGVKVQPDGTVKVRIPVPADFTSNTIFVCYVDSVNGTVENIPAVVKDGYVEFEAEHFSHYAVVEKLGKANSVDIGNISMDYKSKTTITPTIKVDSGVEYTVAYSSSDNSAATVDEYGNVYASGTGSATITCTVTDEYGNVVSDTCEVKVSYNWWQWIIVIVLFGWIWY